MKTLNEYQLLAEKTDKNKLKKNEKALLIPILGLTGEAGSIATEFKKKMRDGDSHKLFKEVFIEELGDILWYLSNIATKMEITLEEIAEKNLLKTKERWENQPVLTKVLRFFDDGFPSKQQLPRKFEVRFREIIDGKKTKVGITFNGKRFGSKLTDNSYEDDGYRYHDIFHLANYIYLGWSPVVRALLKRKRKKSAKIDEVEDGARAWILEEGISVFVYNHAKEHNFYKGITVLDFDLLKTVKKLVSGLEVSICTLGEWEKSILKGYEIYRQLRNNKGGVVRGNMNTKTLTYNKK